MEKQIALLEETCDNESRPKTIEKFYQLANLCLAAAERLEKAEEASKGPNLPGFDKSKA